MHVISQQYDTIDLICWRHFGTTTGVTEQVMTLNTHITDNNPILPIGIHITLPIFQASTQRSIQLWD